MCNVVLCMGHFILSGGFDLFELDFYLNSALLGVGLAMDAFSVSLANGLREPRMPGSRMCRVAGVFALFQAAMPLTGWLCVHTIAQTFAIFQTLIPWIALLLLGYIGGKMLWEGIRGGDGTESLPAVGLGALLLQGVATSIDALSVGFAIAGYDPVRALVCALIISAVTFVICLAGLRLGKRFGTALSGKASLLGGLILIVIGLEVFFKGILG